MQQTELDFSADVDAVEAVLISPRRRQDFIERIVLTHGRRVLAERLHRTGGRRVEMDLRTDRSPAHLRRSAV